MFKYTICLIQRGHDILLLNREKKAWMGCWNGIGGKLEPGETPRDSMIREIGEETGLQDYDLHFKGLITWTGDGTNFGGMYTYLAEVPEHFEYVTPVKTEEGILDWKTIRWIMDQDNVGIASNIPAALELILHDASCYEHHCVYQGGRLVTHTSQPIDPEMESNQEIRDAYFEKLPLSLHNQNS